MPSFGRVSLPRAPAMTPHPTTPCYFLLSLDTLRSTYFIMKKSFIIATVSLTSFFVLSSIVSAQTGLGTNTAIKGIGSLKEIVEAFTTNLVKAVGTMFLALGVVAFFYGVVKYIWGLREGKPEEITKGNKFMGYGLLALFVMFSVYGIIKFGQGILFQGSIDPNKIEIPELQFGKSLGSPSSSGGTGGSPLGPTGSSAGSGGASNSSGGGLGSPSPSGGTSNTSGSSGSSGGSNFNNTGTVTFCDTDNFTFDSCKAECLLKNGVWNSSNNSCTAGGASGASNGSSGTVTTPPASGCTYDDFGTEICTPSGNTTGNSSSGSQPPTSSCGDYVNELECPRNCTWSSEEGICYSF